MRDVLAHPELDLVGLHCHLGSQIQEPVAYELAARKLVGLMAGLRDRFGVMLHELNLGGGHAVPYLPGDPEFDLQGFAGKISRLLRAECGKRRLPVPRLTVEPGRAIVSRAMVTIYRVLAVKHGVRTFVAVDGGMSDNPRPCLYGARYPVRALTAHARETQLATMVGRPPVVAVRDGHARLLIRRETTDDLLLRDIPDHWRAAGDARADRRRGGQDRPAAGRPGRSRGMRA